MTPKDKAAIQHNRAAMKLHYMLAADKNKDIMKLGNELAPSLDVMFNGGFWILSGQTEYYSPKFREALGFEGEHDFPSVPASWQKAIHKEYVEEALVQYEVHKEDPNCPYYLKVGYTKKDGQDVHLVCSGTIVDRSDPNNMIMLGTHELL